MTIEFRCDCGSLLRVPDRLGNQVVRCPSCKEPTLVPKLGEDPTCYPVDGVSPIRDGDTPPSARTAQPPARKLAKSTYRAARMTAPPTSIAGATAWRSASRERQRPQSPLLASFEFPFRDENIFTLLGWGTGFTAVAFMMSVPSPFLIASACRLLILLIAAGYYFHFLSEVVRAAAGGETDLPETSSGEDVFQDAVTWWGAVVIGLFPWWGFHLLNWWFAWDAPTEIGQIFLLVGVLYTPMALLAATLFNTVLAANPLYVLGAILKLPLQLIQSQKEILANHQLHQ
jgi:hypothetical protein